MCTYKNMKYQEIIRYQVNKLNLNYDVYTFLPAYKENLNIKMCKIYPLK